MDQEKDKDDNEHLAFFIDRKETSFNRLYLQYYPELVKYLWVISQDMAWSKDTGQDILLKIFEQPILYDQNKNFVVWLLTIAKNRWKNELRSREVKGRFMKRDIANVSQYPIEDNRSLKIGKIWKEVNILPAAQKEVIQLKYGNNLSIKEISEFLQCSEGTIKSRLFYALNTIRNKVL